MNKEILYSTSDKSINIRLVYIVKSKLKIYSIGKAWPKHTQCLLFFNDILVSFGTVIKHYSDENDQKLAYKLATKKALIGINLKFVRTELWKLVHKELENGILSI